MSKLVDYGHVFAACGHDESYAGVHCVLALINTWWSNWQTGPLSWGNSEPRPRSYQTMDYGHILGRPLEPSDRRLIMVSANVDFRHTFLRTE